MTQELTYKYGHEFFDMSGRSVATELTSSMRKYLDVLRINEEADAAFGFMEDDLQQVLLLEENCHLLIDALNVLSAEYQLMMRCDFDSVDAVLTICEMLLEKRKLTDWYFSEQKTEQLLQYVTELRNKLHSFVEQKKRLCERYADDILENRDIKQVLDQFTLAEGELRSLISVDGMTYSALCDIVAFDQVHLQDIEAALSHDTFAEMLSSYGLPRSSTIAEVKTHISAIERVQHNKVVPSYRRWN